MGSDNPVRRLKVQQFGVRLAHFVGALVDFLIMHLSHDRDHWVLGARSPAGGWIAAPRDSVVFWGIPPHPKAPFSPKTAKPPRHPPPVNKPSERNSSGGV